MIILLIIYLISILAMSVVTTFQQQVEQRLPLLTQERTQYLNKLYAQEFKKNLQRNQALTKQELETLQHQQKQLHSRLDLLKRECQKLQQQLNLDQKMAR